MFRCRLLFWGSLRVLLAGILFFFHSAAASAAESEGEKKEREVKVGVRFSNGDEAYFRKCADIEAAAQEGRVTSESSSDCLGLTPLHVAVAGYPEKIESMIEAGADPAVRTTRGLTPLHVAVQNGHYAAAKTLLENGANPEARTDTGVTPLHALYGAECGSCDDRPESEETRLNIASLLIARGADVDVRDDSGATPLHYAAMDVLDAADKITELVGAFRADASLKDNHGVPISFYAAAAGNTAAAERVRVLAGQLPDETDDSGLGKDEWVEKIQAEIDVKMAAFTIQYITRKISAVVGIQYGWWSNALCNAVGGMICSVSCTPAAAGTPLLYGVCVTSCTFFIASPICHAETAMY